MEPDILPDPRVERLAISKFRTISPSSRGVLLILESTGVQVASGQILRLPRDQFWPGKRSFMCDLYHSP